MAQLSYDRVQSVPKEEFDRLISATEQFRQSKFRLTSPEEKRKIESLLDVREGTLGTEDYFFEDASCPNGHKLGIYDFILTALIDAGHSKSFILHTLVGTKLIINEPRLVRCSTCAEFSQKACAYYMKPGYACETGVRQK